MCQFDFANTLSRTWTPLMLRLIHRAQPDSSRRARHYSQCVGVRRRGEVWVMLAAIGEKVPYLWGLQILTAWLEVLRVSEIY